MPWLILLAPVLADEIIIDDQDGSPGFTTSGDDWATWGMSGDGFDGGDTSYHYTSHTVGGSDRKGTATWTPDITQAGTWQVSTWFRRTENRTPDADFEITDSSGSVTVVSVDQRGDEATGSGWVDLGTYTCDAGWAGCSVSLNANDDDESDEANAIKFELVSAGDPDPEDEEPASTDCDDYPGLGTHTMKLFAGDIDASDWTSPSNAKGEPDGAEASTPNVDAGEYLRAGGWDVCDPPGEETIESVVLGVKARTQYDSGQYEVELRLDGGGGASEVFNGTSLKWHEVDVSGDRAWTWASLGELEGEVSLHSHPGGQRDSDAWVDAWRIEVSYTTTSAPDDGSEEGSGDGSGDGGSGDGSGEGTLDSALDTSDTGADLSGLTPDGKGTGGCSVTAPPRAPLTLLVLVGVVLLGRRRD